MRLKAIIRLTEAGESCCIMGAFGGLTWLANLCVATVSAPPNFSLWWITWKVLQMLIAMGLFYGARRLYEELEYVLQDLKNAAYKEVLYNGLVPQDRRHGA